MNVVGTASVAALAAVGIALVRSRRRGSMSNVPIARRGESFRLHLEGYFTEQQHGRTLNLVLEYGYAGVLPLESMPDYRLIQLLVEEVLYIYDADWLDRPDESTSFMVGDRGVDMAAAEQFGVRGIRCDPDVGISGVVDSILGDVA